MKLFISNKKGSRFTTEQSEFRRKLKIYLTKEPKLQISKLVTKFWNGIQEERTKVNMANLTAYGRVHTLSNLLWAQMHFSYKNLMVQSCLGVLSMAGCSNTTSANFHFQFHFHCTYHCSFTFKKIEKMFPKIEKVEVKTCSKHGPLKSAKIWL